MRTFTIIFLILLLSSVTNGQSKVDIDKANKMVAEKDYLSALQILSPCLIAKSAKEIANLEKCLYIGEEIAIKAVSVLSIKYRKSLKDMASSYSVYDQSYYIKQKEMTDRLLSPYLEAGISPNYSEITDSCIYEHEFFEALNNIFPNSKYQDEVEYILIDQKASVNNWEQWISELEDYVKRHPTGKYSLRAKLDLARNYSDLWNLVHPDHDWSFLVVEFPKDAKLANAYKQKALSYYSAILNAQNKSLLTEQEISAIKKQVADLNMNKAGGGLSILRGYD